MLINEVVSTTFRDELSTTKSLWMHIFTVPLDTYQVWYLMLNYASTRLDNSDDRTTGSLLLRAFQFSNHTILLLTSSKSPYLQKSHWLLEDLVITFRVVWAELSPTDYFYATISAAHFYSFTVHNIHAQNHHLSNQCSNIATSKHCQQSMSPENSLKSSISFLNLTCLRYPNRDVMQK